MEHERIDNSQQLAFLQNEPTTKKEKCAAIPIYRVSLVRESRLNSYHKQIRSSADAAALLHAYLADVDREHLCAA